MPKRYTGSHGIFLTGSAKRSTSDSSALIVQWTRYFCFRVTCFTDTTGAQLGLAFPVSTVTIFYCTLITIIADNRRELALTLFLRTDIVCAKIIIVAFVIR